MQTHATHPDDVRDLTFSFVKFLGSTGDTITAADFTAEPGVTLGAESRTLGTATVRVSGGTAGVDYRVTCQITTSSGQVVNRSAILQVREL
ncbi:hypothetical protein KNU22_gp36 [Gordonia phage Stultus]|uniref:Minor tail protein n=3 Tax=Vividuovirus TaxID=2560251 RepID=A0A3G3M8U1_9CAUD|nr:hypothetical protein KNU20_gp36 [Gordonia phage Geodirt]YP_010099535.1 hypothetical protein KNU22_gp36 [Gordonia phage Stultus]YP_010109212.1 hypothetical protein KNV14_gp38 [Gordonia Phage Barsten]UQT02055.1 hypothetical protein SEA_CHADMASTERC_38 [Gordonia phage ChadMasterC]UVT31837.1 hypothetical protein SEA_KEWPIEDOLL_37 [Gordonia phage Kewpiedoll]WNY14831.1 hypothetical protein SEA_MOONTOWERMANIA_37 [Gordonia phage MoontowerMania]AYR02930.1 hypothetical protein SEA_GEODIRT_36 [Gordoni